MQGKGEREREMDRRTHPSITMTERLCLMPAQQHEKIFFRLTPKSLSPTYNKSRIFPLTQSRNEFQVKVLISYSMNLCAQGQYLKKSLKQEDNKHHIFQFHMENNSLGKMLKTDDEETSRGWAGLNLAKLKELRTASKHCNEIILNIEIMNNSRSLVNLIN